MKIVVLYRRQNEKVGYDVWDMCNLKNTRRSA